MTGPVTEAQLLAARTGTYTLEELYDAVQEAGLTERAAGTEVVHGATDLRWKRRVRGALQTLRRQGAARRAGPGVWVLDGPPEAPRRAVLVTAGGRPDQLELRLSSAADLLADLPEPADLILSDPPYGLDVGAGPARDTGARIYQRDASRVVAGYRDVPATDYRAFTTHWVQAAAAALRPGGHLAVITGPQQAAWVQVACEDAGLEYVNSIAVGKVFALRTTRRYAHAHWTVTVTCKGPLTSRQRVFRTPPDLPKARSGRDYPQDLWPVGDVGRADAAPGALRYPNSLPVTMVDRLMHSFTRDADATPEPDLVCDPFLGGGTTALVAMLRGLRFLGGDLNPAALAFTAQRLSSTRLATC